ncbi:hypothetical protein B0J12DRAFT_695112 [Macrophomina phaseolina]|uniref:Fe2OG dioxygenase domain-containing protein n=1 Tax=Macrophomina phaseolina TaxID=35725 RepID=A0ABQ8GU15_9PEZI|nr:hypothetical protein B0J12DRAFT_695112 [Macrophomina phaseolina]
MSSSFFADLLQQKQPQFQTNKALIVVGLQNDFCSPNGKLPVTQPPGLLDRIKLLVPAFREHAGHVIWVRTELQPNQPADDADDADAIVTSVPGESASSEDDGSSSAELTLDDLPPTSGSRRHPSDLLKRIRARSRKAEKDADAALEDELFLTQGGTTLLLTLRSKLITELYVCGCISNISVYATAVEAARHGIEIYLVDDCVGYRKLSRHREAIRQMVEYMGAQTVSSASLIAQLTGETEKGDTSQGSKADSDHDLGDMLKNLKIKDKDGHQCRGSSSPPKPTEAASPPSGESAVAVSASLLEVADNDDALLDETTLLMERHSIRSANRPSASSCLRAVRVPSKIRSKSQSPSDKTVSISKEDDKPSAESVRSGQAAPTSRPKPTSSGGSSSDSLKTSTSRPETSKAAGDKADSPNTETVGQQSPKKESQRQQSKKTQSLATLPTLGPSDKIGEGDSQIIHNFLPLSLRAPADPSKSLEEVIFDKLYNEVRWQKMMHAQGEVPRLVSVQGDFSSDGSMPIYRHPSDESLPLLHFSPAVLRIRNQVEQLLKHPVNHVLIQLYRGGQDYISEHSDKTLDIVRGSNIVNVSFGAQRTMRLRTKRPAKPDQAEDNKAPSARQTQRISMPHNSVFVLGPQTNMRWLHGINADKRPSDEKSDQEKGFSGMRISLTFRHIGTFISSDSSKIWGQGATSKRKASAKHVINGDDKETDRLIQAFGKENQSSEFDWDQTYGSGSDVLHFRPSPTSRPETPILYTSHSDVEKQAVVLALDHLGLACAVVEPPPPPPELPDVVASSASRSICLRDTDPLHTEVCSAPLILSYLQTIHSSLKQSDCAAAAAATQTYLAHASHLYRLCAPFLSTPNPPPTQSSTPSSTEAASPRLTLSPHIAELLTADLAALEELRASDHLRRDHDSPSPYLVDNEFSVADCAVWPLVNALKAVCAWEGWRWSAERWPELSDYWAGLVGVREDVRRLVPVVAEQRSRNKVVETNDPKVGKGSGVASGMAAEKQKGK